MIVLGCFIAIVLFILFEVLWAYFNAKPVPQPTIPRAAQTMGSGPALTYVVMGDSTTIAQGGDYAKGYPVKTAEFLAQTHKLTWANVGQGGARAKDVADKQTPQAIAYHPDIVLVAVTANDITHYTPLSAVRESLLSTIVQLRQANPEVKIILTGAPDMGSIPRFPQPMRWLAGERTKAINTMVQSLAAQQRVTFAPIAEKTGPEYRKHPEYFAADKFHPNTQGYELWTPVIVKALQK